MSIGTKKALSYAVAFIGEYGNPDEVLDALDSLDFEPFLMELDGFGSYGDLYWAGIKENEELRKLVKRIRRALADNGIPFDRKRFSPHITVLRKASYSGNLDLKRFMNVGTNPKSRNF